MPNQDVAEVRRTLLQLCANLRLTVQKMTEYVADLPEEDENLVVLAGLVGKAGVLRHSSSKEPLASFVDELFCSVVVNPAKVMERYIAAWVEQLDPDDAIEP